MSKPEAKSFQPTVYSTMSHDYRLWDKLWKSIIKSWRATKSAISWEDIYFLLDVCRQPLTTSSENENWFTQLIHSTSGSPDWPRLPDDIKEQIWYFSLIPLLNTTPNTKNEVPRYQQNWREVVQKVKPPSGSRPTFQKWFRYWQDIECVKNQIVYLELIKTGYISVSEFIGNATADQLFWVLQKRAELPGFEDRYLAKIKQQLMLPRLLSTMSEKNLIVLIKEDEAYLTALQNAHSLKHFTPGKRLTNLLYSKANKTKVSLRLAGSRQLAATSYGKTPRPTSPLPRECGFSTW